MPYQRSTQASGFRRRTGPDESKQLRQYADALDKQRKENVAGRERQGVQWTNEMTRIDALASKKDTYELQNLRNFSKTLDNFLDTVATKVVKPVFDQQIEDGITKGIKYQQGEPDVVAEIDASDAQLKEIEDKIALQSAKVSQTEQAIRDQWEKEGKIASLEEEYRLLNIKKLGSNRAFGFRKGMLMQSAVGWDAFRDSSLIYNPENERSTENIGTEEDPIIVGHYHRYTGEDGFEKRKAILGHLTNKYVVEKGKESGLSESFINKLLTRPILQSNADFQQKEAKKALLEEAAASSENNKFKISQGIEGIDSSHEQLELNVQNWILTEPGNVKALNTAGSNTLNAIDGLVEAMIGEASELRTDAMKNEDDQLDFIDAIENKIKVYVPGLSKRVKNENGEWVYEKKFLHELWPNKFNIDNIEALLAEETGKFQREKYNTISSLITADKNRILKDFALNRDTQAFDTAIGVMENNPEYLGHPGIDGLKKKMEQAKEKINYPRDLSDKKLNDLFEENNGKPIRDTHPTLRKLHEDTIKQGILNGKIDAELFHNEDAAKAAHLNNVKRLQELVIAGLNEHAGEIEWDKDDSQVVKAINLLDAKLYNYTKGYLSADKGTVEQAGASAFTQLLKEVESHINNDIPSVDGKNTWEINDKGFTNAALNDVVAAGEQPYRDINTEVIKDDATIKKFNQRVKTSGHVDILSDKSQAPVVKVEDFEFDSAGTVKPVWEELSRLDPLKRTAEMIYDLQADKFPMIQKGNWPQDVKDEIAVWESLYPNVRAALVNGDFNAAKRAMQEIGKLDIDSTIGALLTKDGDFLIREDEIDPLLSSLGLPPMTKEELEANPEVLLAAYKKKIITVTEQVQTVTTDQNQAIRMVFAGLKFDDINKWNDGDFGKYTMAALNSYYSGDRRPLEKLEGKLNLDVNGDGTTLDLGSGELVQVYEDPGNDINAINTQLTELDANEPPKLIKTGNIPYSLGLLAETQVNPAYTAWSKQKQLLNDRALFIDQSAQGFVQPTDLGAILSAGKRLVGDTRYSELQDTVIEKFPNLKVHPEYGYIYDPARGYARIGTKEFKAKEMMQTLLMNEVIGGQSIEESDIIDKDNVLGTPLTQEASAYELNSDYAGRFKDADLVTMKGYAQSGDGRTIRIRKDVANNLESMLDAAAADNVLLNFSPEDNYGSGYRTREGSHLAYIQDPSKAAKPGQSMHNLGTAVDFEFDLKSLKIGGKSLVTDSQKAEAQLEWLKENGPKYGFFPWSEGGKGTREEAMERLQNLKLDSHESWHWDYRPDLMETN